MVDGGTFNGRSISGIGPVKTGRIWYQAETTLLGPGTDYLDLSRSLQQACTNLIGSAGIGAAECESVRRAVEATEMDAAAATDGVHLVAPVCPADAPLRTDLFVDDFEAGLTRWNTSAGGAARSFETFEGSSQSGTTSMFVDDPAGAGVAQARMAGGVPIPAGVRTYLRFDHSFHFDYSEGPRRFWDGGLVGISTTGPTGGYADVGTALPADAAVNGYNGVLVADDPNTQVIESRNQYHGRPAFGGVTQTYQSTRYELTSLAGKLAFVGFFMGSDSSVGATGWFIDDVAIYTCSSDAPPASSGFTAVGPERVFDTRGESANALVSVPVGRVAPGSPLVVPVAGLAGGSVTPVSGVGAVSLNVAVTNPAAAGFVTVFPCANRRLVASVNFGAGQTVSNAVVAPVSAAGTVCFFSLVPTDVVVDINGWFAAGSSYSAVGPERVFDTRGESPGALVPVPLGKVGPGAELGVQVTGLGAAAVTPVSGVGAVSLNVAVTNPAAAGFVTVYPCAQPAVGGVRELRGGADGVERGDRAGVGGGDGVLLQLGADRHRGRHQRLVRGGCVVLGGGSGAGVRYAWGVGERVGVGAGGSGGAGFAVGGAGGGVGGWFGDAGVGCGCGVVERGGDEPGGGGVRDGVPVCEPAVGGVGELRGGADGVERGGGAGVGGGDGVLLQLGADRRRGRHQRLVRRLIRARPGCAAWAVQPVARCASRAACWCSRCTAGCCGASSPAPVCRGRAPVRRDRRRGRRRLRARWTASPLRRREGP